MQEDKQEYAESSKRMCSAGNIIPEYAGMCKKNN
jgi:hypothetical protein